MRVLFILKKNEMYSFVSYCRRSSGLFNSTRFIIEGLKKRGMHAHIIEVNDNNDIDREVLAFQPEIVIIEALWVVPSKFPILQKLHPKVKWFCHLHSHVPFLALEGIAMEWINQYSKLNVGLIANSVDSYKALRAIVPHKDIVYLPNVYISHYPKAYRNPTPGEIHIGCFGAVRPLKNQLLQAIAAIKFAHKHQKHLYFHMNGSREETGGAPVLKNLRALFKDHHQTATLIEHKWMEPDEFLNLLRDRIDIGMQVSLTETFNVVCADYVTAGIPVVASKEVTWISDLCKADQSDIDDVIEKMNRVYKHKLLPWWNQILLNRHSKDAQNMWFHYLKNV